MSVVWNSVAMGGMTSGPLRPPGRALKLGGPQLMQV
jgi:hypothetical protein